MWKTTGDVRWRERGWKIFEALQRETKTAVGYSSITSVERLGAPRKDEMPRYDL